MPTKKEPSQKEGRSESQKPKHFILASSPEIQREIEATLNAANKLQAASDKAFRLELATA